MLYRCSSSSVPNREGSCETDGGRTCQLILGGSRNWYLEGHEPREQSGRRPRSLQSEAWEPAFLQRHISRGLALEVGLSLLWPIVTAAHDPGPGNGHSI